MPCLHTHVIESDVVANNDQLYTCTNRPDYLSVYYHRSGARSHNKGIWAISREEEVYRFYCAHDNDNKTLEYASLWHIENENTYVGKARELISYFPAPSNDRENWHGYPFTFARKAPKDRIKALKAIAERLSQKGELSVARAKKIRQGEL